MFSWTTALDRNQKCTSICPIVQQLLHDFQFLLRTSPPPTPDEHQTWSVGFGRSLRGKKHNWDDSGHSSDSGT